MISPWNYSVLLLYVDDCKLFKPINDFSELLKLEEDFEKLNDLCVRNQLFLKINKCSCVLFTRRTNALEFDYKIINFILNKYNHVNDHGVIFESKLSFIYIMQMKLLLVLIGIQDLL